MAGTVPLDSKSVDSLPKFANPPVAETVMGVDFPPIPGWNVTHYGLFYSKVQARYPKVELQPPLPEDPDESAPRPVGVSFQLIDGPLDTRCWFIDKTDSQLLQVQANRFLRNWRKREGAGDYPHYKTNRAEFEFDWQAYIAFVQGNGLPLPAVRQCEMTYINLLEKDKGWASPGELQEIFPFWKQPGVEGGLLHSPEAANFKMAFKLPNSAGRLHVSLQNVMRVSDGKDMLQLTLTARGRPPSGETADLLKWFDLGHEWTVRGFEELTSKKMHLLWKKKVTS